MSKRKVLMNAFLMLCVIAAGFLVVPFYTSLRLNAEQQRRLPRIDLPGLGTGKRIVLDIDEGAGYRGKRYLIFENPQDAIHAFVVPTQAGRVQVPEGF